MTSFDSKKLHQNLTKPLSKISQNIEDMLRDKSIAGFIGKIRSAFAIVFLFSLYACFPSLTVEINSGNVANGGASDNINNQLPSDRWSNPATWPSGSVPADGDAVMIPNGKSVLLDVRTARLTELHLSGKLVADPLVDVSITADKIHIMSGGLLEIGNEERPYTRSARILLTGAPGIQTPRSADGGLDNNGNIRALHVENGGKLVLKGDVPATLRVRLRDHGYVGDRTLSIDEDVKWKAGTRIAISITDFYGIGTTEIHELAQDASNRTLTLKQSLQTFRWGRMQYPRDPANPQAGQSPESTLSFFPSTFNPASDDTPSELDQRATILNLSRNIVIEGENDSNWTTHGFGCHTMIMGIESIAQVSGVAFERCGQRRAMGRYPFHWHMLSYSETTGAYFGDVDPDKHFLKDSVVLNSENRAVTIHGTNGVLVDNNFAVNIKGHAFFLEDGVERRNTISRNVAMKILDPGNGVRIKAHDSSATGFWITNPDNRVVENMASEAQIGFWNSFALTAFGLSRNVVMNPNGTPILEHRGNIAHSNARFGIMTEDAVYNEAGNVGPIRYEPRNAQGARVPAHFSQNQIWKNREGGYLNRVWEPIYDRWVAADNDNIDFTGQTMAGAIRDALFIARSLNSASPFTGIRKRGVASYHFSLNIVRPTALNYPVPLPQPYVQTDRASVYNNGFFDGRDLYIDAVGFGMFRNHGWKLFNSHPGYIPPPTAMDGLPNPSLNPNGTPSTWISSFSITAAIRDFYGYWGPEGSWLTPNHPFFTYGLNTNEIYDPNTSTLLNSGRIAVSRKFMGINDIHLNGVRANLHLRADRLNPSTMGPVQGAHHEILSQTSWLPGMRHFSLQNNGATLVSFPSNPIPGLITNDEIELQISGASDADISGILVFPWRGPTNLTQVSISGINNISPPPLSMAQGLGGILDPNTSGNIWFNDEAAQRIYVRIKGGFHHIFWAPNASSWNCIGPYGVNHPAPLPTSIPYLFTSLLDWVDSWSLDPEKVSDGCMYLPGMLEVRRL